MRIYYFGELITDSRQLQILNESSNSFLDESPADEVLIKSSSPATLVGDIIKNRPDYSSIARKLEKKSSEIKSSPGFKIRDYSYA